MIENGLPRYSSALDQRTEFKCLAERTLETQSIVLLMLTQRDIFIRTPEFSL